jgi:hypothetical protein
MYACVRTASSSPPHNCVTCILFASFFAVRRYSGSVAIVHPHWNPGGFKPKTNVDEQERTGRHPLYDQSSELVVRHSQLSRHQARSARMDRAGCAFISRTSGQVRAGERGGMPLCWFQTDSKFDSKLRGIGVIGGRPRTEDSSRRDQKTAWGRPRRDGRTSADVGTRSRWRHWKCRSEETPTWVRIPPSPPPPPSRPRLIAPVTVVLTVIRCPAEPWQPSLCRASVLGAVVSRVPPTPQTRVRWCPFKCRALGDRR